MLCWTTTGTRYSNFYLNERKIYKTNVLEEKSDKNGDQADDDDYELEGKDEGDIKCSFLLIRNMFKKHVQQNHQNNSLLIQISF